MPKLEDIDESLDPIIRAAMIDDPEDEETKGDNPDETPSETPVDTSEEDEGKEAVEPEKDEPEVVEDEVPEKGKSDEEGGSEEGKKLTRKEKREAKRKRYLESIRKEGENNSSRQRREELLQGDPNYQPLDYDGNQEFEAEDLKKDREQYGKESFSRGAELERHYAKQENFWQSAEYEAKLLQANPKYSFLDENNTEAYDPELTQDLNELFMIAVGYDEQTQTVRRDDISYARFVETEVERMERWASLKESKSVENLAAQRSTSGIRPSGSPSKGLGKLKPGDISKMSQAEFEKHEAEIDRQILAELNQ